jgi:hypothetical protein
VLNSLDNQKCLTDLLSSSRFRKYSEEVEGYCRHPVPDKDAQFEDSEFYLIHECQVVINTGVVV